MRQCPKCGAYMTPYIQYTFDGSRLFYVCLCGYSTKYEDYIMSNHTVVNKDTETILTNHT